MTDKKRDPLPEGYQFGDMGDPFERMTFEQRMAHCFEHYVRPAAEAIKQRSRPIIMCSCSDWMTCEHPWPEMLPYMSLGWNVIEGEPHDPWLMMFKTGEDVKVIEGQHGDEPPFRLMFSLGNGDEA